MESIEATMSRAASGFILTGLLAVALCRSMPPAVIPPETDGTSGE
jgi:hypothetical protein